MLGHHYQRDDVIQHADVTGDSYKLARSAPERTDARWIVFAASTSWRRARISCVSPTSRSCCPIYGGCSMADMAPTDDVIEAGAALEQLGLTSVMPVTYMNSTAEIKAYCGERGGAVCTSSNCRAIFEWAFAQRDQIFFFPDEHLGRNTAIAMGIAPERIVVWDPKRPLGGSTEEKLRQAKVIVWKGCCSVHTKFELRHVLDRRAEDPD